MMVCIFFRAILSKNENIEPKNAFLLYLFLTYYIYIEQTYRVILLHPKRKFSNSD